MNISDLYQSKLTTPDRSVAQIGELPQEIRSHAPSLQKNGVQAWVAGDNREVPPGD